MLLKTILITFLAFQVSAKSCNSTKNTRQSASVVGLWKGTFTTQDGPMGTFYFSVKPDGNILVENRFQGVLRIGSGKWTVAENNFNFSATYFYGSPENIGTITEHTAFLDNNLNMKTGVWKNINPNYDTGTFKMIKIE